MLSINPTDQLLDPTNAILPPPLPLRSSINRKRLNYIEDETQSSREGRLPIVVLDLHMLDDRTGSDECE